MEIKTLLKTCVVIGIFTATIQATVNPVTSDMVNPGLYAREVWVHGNTQFYLPVNDPYILDYLLALVTVPLSGYTTPGLIAPGLIVYMGIVLLAGLLAHQLTHDETKTLCTMALVANTPNMSLSYIVYPVWHGSTILLSLIVLNIIAWRPRVETRRDAIAYTITTILMFATVLSDTLALPILVGPLALIGLYKKNMGLVVACMGGVLGQLVKSWGGEMWSGGPYLVNVGGLQNIIGTTPQPMMILEYAASLLKIAGGPLLLTLITYAAYTAYKKGMENRQLVLIPAVGTICMLAGFLIMQNTGGDLGRYLYPLIVLMLIPIGLQGITREDPHTLIVPAILVLCILTNIGFIATMDHDINRKDRELAQYLAENNLTSGYADYWAANLLTYLDDRLEYRPVTIHDDKLSPLYLQSTSRWTMDWPGQTPTLLVYDKYDPLYNWTLAYNQNNTYKEYTYEGYTAPNFLPVTIHIYQYPEPLPSLPVTGPGWFENRGVKPV